MKKTKVERFYKSDNEPENVTQVSIRLPINLHARLKVYAAKKRVRLNSLIISLIENLLDKDD
jgi:predicted HicB family RNase H-like nuclease